MNLDAVMELKRKMSFAGPAWDAGILGYAFLRS